VPILRLKARLRRLRQVDHDFEVSLGYTVRTLVSKQNKNNKTG
jgi:hypothetical protein